jgi:hypothetical protein
MAPGVAEAHTIGDEHRQTTSISEFVQAFLDSVVRN